MSEVEQVKSIDDHRHNLTVARAATVLSIRPRLARRMMTETSKGYLHAYNQDLEARKSLSAKKQLGVQETRMRRQALEDKLESKSSLAFAGTAAGLLIMLSAGTIYKLQEDVSLLEDTFYSSMLFALSFSTIRLLDRVNGLEEKRATKLTENFKQIAEDCTLDTQAQIQAENEACEMIGNKSRTWKRISFAGAAVITAAAHVLPLIDTAENSQNILPDYASVLEITATY